MKLGNRIKRYEKSSNLSLSRRIPLMIRVDGRAFHTYTKGMDRPFDYKLMEAMVRAAYACAVDMQGFKAAYIQSDEATFLLTDYDRHESEAWFDYDLSKVVSISAALMAANFNNSSSIAKLAVFDSRAFSVPREDVVNAFLWRAKDWERNSLQMYARAYFSHKQLHNKKRNDMHEMLHSIGKNWATDLPGCARNGTFLIASQGDIQERNDILPSYDSINGAIGHLVQSEPFVRNKLK